MFRKLSDPEYVAFLNDVDLGQLHIPPWGVVVNWNGMKVLVVELKQDGFLGRAGETLLTDISDANFTVAPQWEWNPMKTYAVWHLPAQTGNRIMEVMQQLPETFNTTTNWILIAAIAYGAAIAIKKL